MNSTGPTKSYVVTEQARVPVLSLVLGYGPMLPILAGAACAWLVPTWSATALGLAAIWAGTILAFLSGVRRGLAFRSPRQDSLPQLTTMIWLFVLALAGFLTAPSRLCFGILVLGFASVGVLDWLAARREEAPPYFARLRPPQMLLAVLGLLALLAKA